MRERKKIDRLYQEKFKDFEATPNEAVWNSISARLREKEEKKAIVPPIWSRVAGIAAILTIILLIGDWIFPSQSRSTIANEEINETLNDNSFSIAESNESSFNEPSVKDPAQKRNLLKSAIPEVAKDENVDLLGSHLTKKNINSGKNHIVTDQLSKRLKKDDPNPIKDLLIAEMADEQLKYTDNGSRGNFEVKTHAAPIYYGNFGKGNFLDPQFSDNKSEGEVTYSYGVNVAYNISNKIKIRSGVNMVSMSYNTSGINYQAIIGPVDITSVVYSQNEVQMAEGTGRASFNKQPMANGNSSIGGVDAGLLNQKLGFIEVPVELEYKLIDKKFELNLIGGASILFLDENRVSLNSGSVSAVGKATNLNEVSFSTNIGLGLDYNLTEKFKLNFEPMFKYQLNTFNSPSSNNQPYYLGIYSGFSFKF